MFTDKRFAKLRERFKEVKERYLAMIEEKRNAAARTVISKGRLYNVLPHEAEREGDKLKGKILPEPIPHNDCYIYRLDEQGRVLLSENMSEFLKIPTYFSLYTYDKDFIERIYGANDRPYRVERAYLESGVVKEILCCDKVLSMETLEYTQSVLTDIHYSRESKGGLPFDLKFLYDTKGGLACIHRLWPSGRKDTIYSTAKINFKALEQRLLADTTNAVSGFLREHRDERFAWFGLDAYSGHGYMSLCFDTGKDEACWDSPADWDYCDFASLPLIEFPLDDRQEEKLKKTLIQLAKDLGSSEVFDRPVRILVFNHNTSIADIQ